MTLKKSFSELLKTGMGVAAYSLTWVAILLSLFQVFLISPSRSWAVTGGTTLTVVPYTPTGLTNGTTYYYVVRAFGGGQESGNSNEANAVPADNIVPNAQTGLSAADVAGDNGGAIVLNWTAAASGDVTQQRLYRGTTLGGPYPTLVTTIPNNTTSTYTDNTGLTNGTTYYYVIRAYDGTQESGDSNEANAVPVD